MLNDQPASSPAATPGRDWRGWYVVAALLLVAGVAISGRSLWIDEACTAMKVLPKTLGGWWAVFSADRSADLQMPFYMFYVWGWGRVVGTGEWSLHAANVPWFVAGAVAFVLAFPVADRRHFAAICVVLACPFAWYYLDEARPYSMQLGASLMVVAAMVRLARRFQSLKSPEREVSNGTPPASGGSMAMLLLGLVVLSGSSLLGMVWAGAALLAVPVVLSLGPTVVLVRRYWYLCLGAGCMLLVFAGYYLWTLSLGARASASATTTVASAIFIGYELLGFSGLGPGRIELRTAGVGALRPYLPWLGLYAAAVAGLIGAALAQAISGRNRRHLALAGCCVLPAAFILAVGCVAHFRALGRHFTPLLPVLLLLLTSGMALLWSRRAAWARSLVLLFCVLSLASCLSVRFAARHQKDDYRAAAALARAELSRGRTVWWNAADEGARYYQVPVAQQPGAVGAAWLVLNPTRDTLKSLSAPQVVVASKPDVYDGASALGAYLQEQQFTVRQRFTAFVIWERRGQ